MIHFCPYNVFDLMDIWSHLLTTLMIHSFFFSCFYLFFLLIFLLFYFSLDIFASILVYLLPLSNLYSGVGNGVRVSDGVEVNKEQEYWIAQVANFDKCTSSTSLRASSYLKARNLAMH